MKKIIASCSLLFTLSVCEILADTLHQEESVSNSIQDEVSGFYIAFGVLGERMNGKVAFLGDTVSNNLLDPAYVHLIPKGRINPVSRNLWCFGSSAAFGYASIISGMYVGLEFLVDIKPCKSLKNEFEMYGLKFDNHVRTKAIIPSLTLRLGNYVDRFDTIFSLRVGAAKVGLEYINTKPADIFTINSFKVSKITPLVGISAEKKFGKIGLRFDYEYRFKISKRGFVRDIQQDERYLNASLRGHVVRIMVIFTL